MWNIFTCLITLLSLPVLAVAVLGAWVDAVSAVAGVIARVLSKKWGFTEVRRSFLSRSS